MSQQIDTGTEDLIARTEDGVAILTMNRPKARNALSGPMLGAMERILADAERDPEIGCVVITGACGAFCAGGDVKGMAQGGDSGGASAKLTLDERVHLQRLQQRNTSGRIHEMPKPVIASLPGAAAGAGLSIALACDLRIASENAIMTTAFAKVGFSGDYGGTYFMTRLIGAAKARELYLLSDRVDAKQAEQLGLVNKVVPADALEEETMKWARQLASGPTIAYRYMLENLNRAVNGEMGECLDMEATHHIRCGMTEDHRNAAKAFVNKETPVFKGR